MPFNSIRKSVKQIARKSRSSFYYSFKFLDSRQREAIYTIYSFCRITDDIVDSTEAMAIKEKKLNHWEENLQKAIHTGEALHPVLKNLSRIVREFDIPTTYLFELINGARMDLKNVVFKTWTELYQYCYKVASVVGFMSIHIFGFTNQQSLKYAEKLGIALQLTNILRDVGKDIEMNRIYLPREEMVRHGVTEDDLYSRRYSENFKNFMIFQVQRAESYYQEAKNNLPSEDRKLMLPSLIMKETYFSLLKKIKKINYDTLNNTPVLSGYAKKRIALLTWIKFMLGDK